MNKLKLIIDVIFELHEKKGEEKEIFKWWKKKLSFVKEKKICFECKCEKVNKRSWWKIDKRIQTIWL